MIGKHIVNTISYNVSRGLRKAVIAMNTAIIAKQRSTLKKILEGVKR